MSVVLSRLDDLIDTLEDPEVEFTEWEENFILEMSEWVNDKELTSEQENKIDQIWEDRL